MMTALRVISLFAGIGGFDLGCTQAGMQVVAHVEKDPHCRKLLADKFPTALVLDDVCTAGKNNLPPADVLCAGWPCQDLSVAGKRAGLTGSRSALFYHVPRIAYELKIDVLVWENVPGLLSSDDGRDMLRVLVEFQRCGYSGAWRTLDAQFLGVAQRRRRIFGVFARGHIGAERCAEILSLSEGVRWHPAPRREKGKDVAGTIGGSSQSGGFRTTDLDNNGAFIPEIARAVAAERDGYNDGSDQTYIAPPVTAKWAKGSGGPAGDECQNLVAFDTTQITSKANYSNPKDGEACHPLATGAHPPCIAIQEIGKRQSGTPMNGVGHSQSGDPMFTLQSSDQHGVAHGATVRRLTPRECERLQGFPDDWTSGFSDSIRYRMLGNAVAVPVVRWIAERLSLNVSKSKTETI